MEIVKYTDYEGLKYALSRVLEGIASKYLTSQDANLLLYTNESMSEVTNVKDGLDTLVVNVVRLTGEANSLNESIIDLQESDINILNEAKEYTNNIIGSQTKLEFAVVDMLPTENISSSIIYLVPSEENEDFSHYDEYMYINGEWEYIGTTKTNLGDYYNKSEIDGIVNTINNTLNTKVDKVEGKSLVDDVEIEKLKNMEVYDDTEVKRLIEEKADNLFKTDMNTVAALGGIPANSNLNNMSIQDILTKLLYPYISPTVSSTIKYSPSGGVYEFGQTVTVTGISTNITKKSESITKIDYYVNNSLQSTETIGVENGGSFSTTFEDALYISKSIANTYFQVKVTDASGKVVTSNTSALNFYYPYYYGVIGADVTVTANLIKSLNKQVVAKGNKTYSYSPSYQRMVIAYPKSYGMLKSILDPNGFEQLASFEVTELNIIGLDETSQVYYVYVNGASSNTDFKMKFNY